MGRKQAKQKHNWIVDAILFTGFLASFFLDWTGLAWHQWLGVGVGLLTLYHLAIHWDWFRAVSQRVLGNTSSQSRLFYLLDWAILLCFLTIGFTGMWISTWLDLDLENYLAWKELHIDSSLISLVLILAKIAAHWRWIVRTGRKHFGFWTQPAPIAVPARDRPQIRSQSLNRRDFLQLMGAAGLASILSASNLIDFGQAAGQQILEDQTAAPQIPESLEEIPSQSSCQVICDQGCAYPGQCRRYQDVNENGICDLTECFESERPIQESSPQLETENGISETEPDDLVPENDSVTSSVSECKVLCSRGCAYPGQCPDYIDLNANDLCDLGECLVRDAQEGADQETVSGGGGRRRRGSH